ncbi:hypothetical protein [Methylobacterium nodulans]|uniref:Uncharacterized protein n=1 Tax=Methylobacterium nodulans (strain LMG 21967 / CNCM I-2342 / ORS 2060) TaxID=460265 RepID=B8IXV8_METNO|nr:hypothetical protein [Methylobacterium nodulans]ACL63248.1 hypothetical protein Mnod_8787 [Methylobacterium nodulans ORS 2060]
MPLKRRRPKRIEDHPPLPHEPRPVERERWERHRDEMLASERPGRRPEEWWAYEAPIPWPGYDNETVALYRANLLRKDELAELMAGWKEQAEKAKTIGFYTIGPGRILTGKEAEEAWRRWACIPDELFRD